MKTAKDGFLWLSLTPVIDVRESKERKKDVCVCVRGLGGRGGRETDIERDGIIGAEAWAKVELGRSIFLWFTGAKNISFNSILIYLFKVAILASFIFRGNTTYKKTAYVQKEYCHLLVQSCLTSGLRLYEGEFYEKSFKY